MTQFTESIVEGAALAWLEALGYAVLHGRLRHVLVRLNRTLKGAHRQAPDARPVHPQG